MAINKQKVKEYFSQSAKQYDQYADLQQLVMKRLFTQLGQGYQNILDIGSGTGALIELIAAKYPVAKVTGLDIAEGMLKRSTGRVSNKNIRFVLGDGENLPFGENEFDLIVSSLSLQWMDPKRVFSEVARVLKPRGSFFFSTFGPATLIELKKLGWSINDFPSQAQLEKSLRPYFDGVEVVGEVNLKQYNSIFELFSYLKNIGAQNPAQKKNKGLMTINKMRSLFPANGKVTYEIYYLTYNPL